MLERSPKIERCDISPQAYDARHSRQRQRPCWMYAQCDSETVKNKVPSVLLYAPIFVQRTFAD